MQSLPFPGDVVWIRQQRWRVRRAMRDGHVVRLDVTSRTRALTFLAPFDRVAIERPSAAPRRVRRQELRARLAHVVARAPDPRLPLSLVDARLDLLPHQIEPVLAALAGHCRILLADEVGLGKTIQAGAVVSEVLKRETAPRVLILAPSPLIGQWCDELSERFHLRAERADRDGLQALTRVIPYGENPWRRARLWIGSPDFVKQTHVLSSLPPDPWDLLVIDEAHSVCGASDRFIACAGLARKSRRVVLLTGTPHAGDTSRFHRLTSLGALPGSAPALVFRRTRASLGLGRTRSVRWPRINLTTHEHEALACLQAYEQAVIRTAGTDPSVFLLLSVFRKRALSTFAALGQSIARRLTWIGHGTADIEFWEPLLPFGDDDERDDEDRAALQAMLSIDPRREALWLQRLARLTTLAARAESKARYLSSLIHRTTEPVVVFTEFRDSLEAVMHELRVNRSVAWIHGRQDSAEQRTHLSRFLRGEASVLLATDVAGQGLNLQSRARWVVSLEVPWNPARLEQRIGRVDRIAQPRPTHLTVLVARHEAESGLLLHLSRRILRARAAMSDDVLIDTPVDADVARALVTHADLASDEPRSPTSAICSTQRWRRNAAVVARAIAWRRELARQWRYSPGTSASLIARDATGAREGPRLVVLATPILNGLDELVATAITGARVSGGAIRAGATACTTGVVMACRHFVKRRIAKLSRSIARADARLDCREVQLSSGVQDASASELQPGLFDRRESDAHERLLSDLAVTERACQAAIDRRAAAAPLRQGSAVTFVTTTTDRD